MWTPKPVCLPASVLARLTGGDVSGVRVLEERRLTGSTGAATRGLTHLSVEVPSGRFDIVRKEFRPLPDGPHRHGARDPRHWAYWEREPLAYGSGLLPGGPGVRAPRCFGAECEAVYLEYVGDTPVDSAVAARQLGEWQRSAPVPDVPWLGGHQLAQRLEVTSLDWTSVDADPRAGRLWSSRDGWLARLDRVPHVLCHGDFHVGNLRAAGDDTVVLDWGTLCRAPVGSDLAHLALSAQQDLFDAYLTGLADRFASDVVAFAYRATLALVGASRVHWMLSRGMAVPDGYVDFLWDNRPSR